LRLLDHVALFHTHLVQLYHSCIVNYVSEFQRVEPLVDLFLVGMYGDEVRQ